MIDEIINPSTPSARLGTSELMINKDNPTDEERSLLQLEREKCKESFLYFLKYVKLVIPPTQTSPGGIVPFQITEHIKVFIKLLLTEKDLSVCKSRQIYISTTIAVFVLWDALFHFGSSSELFSAGQREAFELLGKSYRIYDYLPKFLKVTQRPDSQEEMGFPIMASTIKAFPSTEEAGISFTASRIIDDEHEKHPYAERNYTSAKPAIDTIGGQFISIFTPDKEQPVSLAKSLFRNGKIYSYSPTLNKLVEEETEWGTGMNGFTSVFFPYNVIPGRDAEWYEGKKKSLTPEEMKTLTPELYMESNYPRSLLEALRPTQTLSAFNHTVLDEMMGDVKNPILRPGQVAGDEIDSGIVHFYKDYHIGETYIAGTDTSHGIGKDDSVTVIMNTKTGYIVADIMHNRLSPDELALHSVAMLKIYHNPLWFIESNDWGGATIAAAQRLDYRHLGYQDAKRTKVGFNTNGFLTKAGIRGSRVDLFSLLIPAINNHQLTIPNVNGLKEFYDIIRVADPKKLGRIEAASGRKDDYPIAVGICLCKIDEVQEVSFTIKAETLSFSSRR